MFTPIQKLFDMPAIVVDCCQRQAPFGFHPLGKLIDQACKRWGFDDTLIQTSKESEPLCCYMEAIEEFGLEPTDRCFQGGSYLRGDGSALDCRI